MRITTDRIPGADSRGKLIRGAILVVLGAAGMLLWNGGGPASARPERKFTGSPQLISYEQLPAEEGELCRWTPAGGEEMASLRLQTSAAGAGGRPVTPAEAARRKPLRIIRDLHAAYSAVAVDLLHDEVVLADENRFNIMVYNRLDNTPPSAAMTEPKRVLGGLRTKIEFQCDLYVDPATGDIYASNNDTVQRLVVFSRQAKGDVPADRELVTPYGGFGIAVDEEHQELFLTVQHAGAVITFPKMAQGDDAPTRLLQGERTRLMDPHGIAIDTKNDRIFVANWGSVHRGDPSANESAPGRRPRKPNWPVGIWLEGREGIVPASGKFLPPAITVYSRTASGDTAPLRVMEGPQTQLNWPTGIALDPAHGELFVANDMGDSVLVFDANASGDVAPIRVLKGPRSMIKNPTDVYLDLTNNELWTANYGNHAATVHRRTASGDTPPLRVIRSAPLQQPSPGMGNPHAVAYDTKREEILVPS